MSRLTPSERLARLRHRLDCVGHRAYSRDNMESEAAARDFETIERLRAKIAILAKPCGHCGTVDCDCNRGGRL